MTKRNQSKIVMKLKTLKKRLQELSRDARIMRERRAQKKLTIPIVPFVLILCVGAVIGYFLSDHHFLGVFGGLIGACLLFFIIVDE